ncbi:MAG TPA: two-component regulator propeller domain-containing protein, partial [Vicinamibacteria bacterium]|nr:two-component regulator propeller domain-containing protein [Vicinamibacteria bacterium]
MLFPHACRAVPVMTGLLLLGARYSPALDPAKAVTQYSLAAWHTEEGLPHNRVQAIAQTADGYLWLATQEGLARFDGVRFTLFDRRSTAAMSANDVETIYASRDGSLWVGIYGGTLLRYQNGRFRSYSSREGLYPTTISALAEDTHGDLWIGTDGDGLYRLHESVFTRYTKKDGLIDDSVRCLLADPDGSIWIGTPSGLGRKHADGIERYVLPAREHPVAVSALAVDGNGRLWIGTDGDGIYHPEEGRLVRASLVLRDDHVRGLLTDRHGSLWIGTDAGLHRLQAGHVDVLTRRDGLPSDSIRAVFEDREGSLWVGGSGLGQLKDGTVLSYGQTQGLASEDVYAVASAAGKGLWVGTSGGEIALFAKGRFTPVAGRAILRGATVLALREDREGRLWAGTDQGLYRFDRGRWTSYAGHDGLPADDVRSILEDREGRLWIGTDGGGLARLDGNRFVTLTTRDGLPSDHLRALLEDRDGTLWVATYGGLAALRDGRVTSYTARDGLAHDLVRSLHQDGNGVLWVGTYGGGLSRVQSGRITTYTTRQGLFDDVIFEILEDGRGRLWMSCNKGIFSVSLADLESFAAGRQASVHSVAYGRSDGMRNPEANGGSPAGLRTEDGRLWFATAAGLVSIDPAAISGSRPAPPAFVEEAWVDGERADLDRGLDLAPGNHRLQLAYTALSLVAPDHLRFAYALEGFDADWIDAGTRRQTSYTNVPAGRYRFRVRARDEDGAWNEAGVPMSLRVRSHWYRTRAFFLIASAVLVLAFAGAYRLRVRGLLARERELGRRVEQALADVKVLSGLLPICASCKKIRDDRGYWNQL